MSACFWKAVIVPQGLAAWLSCLYAIDPDTFAVVTVVAASFFVSLALPGTLHNVTCSLVLHMMCSTCDVMLLHDLCFAAAGCVPTTCLCQSIHMA